MSIIGAEDEDFENDLNDPNEDQCKHFNSIELLKERPTHLLVFMQHVILQFDPAPLLCYLHAELFKKLFAKENAKENAKEIKKQFVEFYNTFLDKGAILRVSIPVTISNELDRTRADLLSEEVQKRYVQEIQNLQIPDVKKQLEDFRHKRMMGMTQNEEELIDVENHYPTDRVPMKMKEAYVAETLLEKMSDMHQSIFAAVTAYMKHLDVKTRGADSKSKSKGMFFKRQAKVNTKPFFRFFKYIVTGPHYDGAKYDGYFLQHLMLLFAADLSPLQHLPVLSFQTRKDDTPKKPKPIFSGIPPWRSCMFYSCFVLLTPF
uniref:Regulator of G protein signalling-like domain-containing protein n=1 Tax=Oryzias sinensis TaxID=183150 RepID=A0A8C7Y1C1_9TELE